MGQTVEGGVTVIAAMGNTGFVVPAPTASNPTGGTHLHLEVWHGYPNVGLSKHFSPWTLLQ